MDERKETDEPYAVSLPFRLTPSVSQSSPVHLVRSGLRPTLRVPNERNGNGIEE